MRIPQFTIFHFSLSLFGTRLTVLGYTLAIQFNHDAQDAPYLLLEVYRLKLCIGTGGLSVLVGNPPIERYHWVRQGKRGYKL